MKGNTGLQLYLVDGKKMLVGTQRPDAIKRAMEKMMSE
jgi:chaperone required for assembly of F1-ATPase